MARDFDEIRQEMYSEMRGILPTIFATTNPVSANILNSFVWSLSSEAAELVKALEDFKDDQNVLTSASAIGSWEDLINLSQRPDMSLLARRSRVFSRTSGGPTTLAVLKNVVRKYVDGENFNIFEYHTLNDPTSAFRFKIQINRMPGVYYDEVSLQQDVLRLQPAHCGDIVEIEDRWRDFTDAFAFTDSVSAFPLYVFTIGTSTIEGPDVIGLN